MAFQKVKGTTDFYPDEKAYFSWMTDCFKRTAKRFNFKEIETPALESIKLLTEKEGEEIKQQIFTLEKKGDEELGLRFDITVPCARMFIEKQKELPKPVKWFYTTRMWRYEKPQKGRLREFYQFGIELFGADTPQADAEVINLAITALEELGLKKDEFVVRINNRKLLQGMLSEIVGEKNIEETIRIIDKKQKISDDAFVDELKKLKLKDSQIKDVQKMLSITNIKDTAQWVKNNLAEEGKLEMERVLPLLPKDCVKFDLSTARGLTYYTGTVFEIFDDKETLRALCGGGCYNKMIEQFGGDPTPATGFGMGFSTVQLLLKEKGLGPKNVDGPEYYVAIVNEEMVNEAVRLASLLRKTSSVELDLLNRKLAKQLANASDCNAKKAIIVGPDELKEGKVTLRDLLSRTEKKVDITDVEKGIFK